MVLDPVSSSDPGVSPSALDSFIEGLKEKELDVHTLMVLVGGKTAVKANWRPYPFDGRHMMFSLTKSFMSTAVGFAVQEGLVDLDTPVGGLFPDQGVEDRALTLRHLLTMSAGHATEPWVFDKPDWIKQFLDSPRIHEPGTSFLYSTPASCTAGAVVERRSGMDLIQYLTPRLFEPLGIDGTNWERVMGDHVAGGYGLSLKVEEVAKFGQFILNKGSWNGKQLLNPEWIETATSKHISNGDDPNNDWNQGYGFQFWRCRHNAFRGDGAFGQFCLILPEKNAVIAMTSGVSDLQGVLDHVWEKLLPGIGATGHGLQVRDSLEIASPPSKWPGIALEKTRYKVEPNEVGVEWIEIEAGQDTASLAIDYGVCDRRLLAGLGYWRGSGSVVMDSRRGGDLRATPVWATASWQGPGAITFRAALIETPMTPVYAMTWEGEDCELRVTGELNLFREPNWPVLKGKKTVPSA